MTKLSSNIINCIEHAIGFKNNSNKIPLHEPSFKETNSWDYVKNCIDTGWVSNTGEWVNKFEEQICAFTGSSYAIAVSNGTVGLRLALHTLGVKNDDEVLMPPLTFVATANAVSHLGAIPHFIDIEKNSLGLCPVSLEERLNDIAIRKNGFTYNKETGRRIAALMAVHVFGNPADLTSILKITRNWGIPVLEDAAEALGSWIKFPNKNNAHCGLLGDVGVISFNGNKLITTGGGGVLITHNKEIAELSKHLSTTAKLAHEWEFDHDHIGWNDRLPNLNAALGLAQIEVLDRRLEMKRKLLKRYEVALKDIENLTLISPTQNSLSNNWLISISLNFEKLEELKKERNELLLNAIKRNLMLRPIWKPLHKLSIYQDTPRASLKCAENFEFRIINLPSSPQLIE